ncbi:MAG: hypothetical protein ACKOC7_10700 [Sphingomonadales bacterium]
MSKYQYFVRYKKTADHLIARGFEPELVRAALASSGSANK